MTRGKNICKQLKEVRKRIAEENGIPLEIKECSYKGECRGTCPRCEAEVRYLENALANKLKFGKVATIAGLSLGLAAGCGHPLEGDVADPNYVDTTPDTPDTVQPADTAKPIWREPPQDELVVVGEDIVLGGLEVIDEEAVAIPDSDAYYEEGEIEGEPAIYPVVEEQPMFPGGQEALEKFLQDNIQYPQLAAENNIGGRVYVSFVIEPDGSVTLPRLLRDIGGGCGAEAVRIVKMMPKWTPGKNGGKAVRTSYNLPIYFDNEKNRIPIIEGIPAPSTPQKSVPDSVKVIVR